MWTRRVHLAGVRLAHLFATKPFVLLEDGAKFTKSEAALASALYWIIVPAIQFAVALFLADTWQYFTHRLFHQNRFLYKHVHSMHHEIHVNFAWGAFYNHPAETILIDVIGFPICLQIAQLSTRQATVAAVVWTIKTVVDHCGYAFPYGGSPPFFHPRKEARGLLLKFWDYVLGTMWVASDTKAQGKYAKAKEQAEAQMEKSHAGNSAITSGTSTSVSREI
ncbi:MAG: hypothetical protein M1815_004530 [Lichina confinis]|nr:MAG: hypothetical protein M1815_004530 [Lichina confinis]